MSGNRHHNKRLQADYWPLPLIGFYTNYNVVASGWVYSMPATVEAKRYALSKTKIVLDNISSICQNRLTLYSQRRSRMGLAFAPFARNCLGGFFNPSNLQGVNMKEYLFELDQAFPLTTREIARSLNVTGARIRQIAPDLEKHYSACLKVGQAWKFSPAAIPAIQQFFLRN